jgi:hypothetical protein
VDKNTEAHGYKISEKKNRNKKKIPLTSRKRRKSHTKDKESK